MERVKRYDKGIFEEGLEIGKERGVEIGRETEKLEIARKLKSRGMDIDSVSEITGLDPREIEAL